MTQPTTPSIRDLEPLDKGGSIARAGFSYQDHVTTSFCLAMLLEGKISEVWCETHDDITLFSTNNGKESVEFVQVKNTQLDQLWSIAKLCEKGDSPKSILERSFDQDRCSEPRLFRLVTSLGVKKELDILTLPLTSPKRKEDHADCKALLTDLNTRTNGLKSKNGNSISFWVQNTFWEVRTEEAVKSTNLNKLQKWLEEEDVFLSFDQKESLYDLIVQYVKDAATLQWDINPDAKHINCEGFYHWLKEKIENVLHPSKLTTGPPLVAKMADARIEQELIQEALEQRREYRKQMLSPQYLSLTDSKLISGEVQAHLQHLRADLLAGNITESGLQFYARCLKELKTLQSTIAVPNKPPLSFLQGCMYDITNRCIHRFNVLKGVDS